MGSRVGNRRIAPDRRDRACSPITASAGRDTTTSLGPVPRELRAPGEPRPRRLRILTKVNHASTSDRRRSPMFAADAVRDDWLVGVDCRTDHLRDVRFRHELRAGAGADGPYRSDRADPAGAECKSEQVSRRAPTVSQPRARPRSSGAGGQRARRPAAADSPRVWPGDGIPSYCAHPQRHERRYVPSTEVLLHSARAASRPAALLLLQIRPVFSVVAPCRPGASRPSMLTRLRVHGTRYPQWGRV